MGFWQVEVPIRLVRSGNSREHWRSRSNRTRGHKRAVRMMLDAKLGPRACVPPMRVVITRLSPRLMDVDNNVSCCKDVQDAIADWAGEDDAYPGFDWQYAQQKAKTHAVRIEIFDRKLRQIGVGLFGGPAKFVDEHSIEDAVLAVLGHEAFERQGKEPFEVYVIDPPFCGTLMASLQLSVRLSSFGSLAPVLWSRVET